MEDRKFLKPRRGPITAMKSGTKKNIILEAGEIFVEYPDTGVGKGKSKLKIGDGITRYEHLPYAVGDTSTDPITFTQGSQSTIAAALADITTGATLNTIVGSVKQAISLCNTAITTINQETIPEMRENFQAGVDSIYYACRSKGSTPASKSLADVVAGIQAIQTATIHSRIFSANTRSSNIDMGESHDYRYIDTTGVPNINDLSFAPNVRESNIDMGVDNRYRYVNTTGVPNSNSGRYDFPSTYTSGDVNLGDTNTVKYVNASQVYTRGYSDGQAAGSAKTINWVIELEGSLVGSKDLDLYFNGVKVYSGNTGYYSDDNTLSGTAVVP